MVDSLSYNTSNISKITLAFSVALQISFFTFVPGIVFMVTGVHNGKVPL